MKKIKEIDLKYVKESLKKLDLDKSELGLNLLNEVEFMKRTLESLKTDISTKGVITSMCQGKYDIERANPALSQYNSLIKNYNSTIKQITDLLVVDQSKSIEDEFDDFNK